MRSVLHASCSRIQIGEYRHDTFRTRFQIKKVADNNPLCGCGLVGYETVFTQQYSIPQWIEAFLQGLLLALIKFELLIKFKQFGVLCSRKIHTKIFETLKLSIR